MPFVAARRIALSVTVVVVAAAVLWVATPTHAGTAELPPPRFGPGLIPGLRVAPPDSPCAGLFEVIAQATRPLCSHGADPVPPKATSADIHAEAPPTTSPSDSTTTTTVPTPVGATYCFGNGVSGRRVAVVYAHKAAGRATPADIARIESIAADADAVFNLSARETGEVRHLRFEVDHDCRPVIHDVRLTAASAGEFGRMIDQLVSLGYDHEDRKYLVLTDTNTYCGIATMTRDSRPYSNNLNDVSSDWARVDRGCWGGFVSAHELMHSLGGVQIDAPHSTGAGHCYDNVDLMCYADGGPYFKAGGRMSAPCSQRDELFDCNHDDYFVAGEAAPRTYIANHWNAARNGFLETRDGSTTFPGPSLAPPALAEPPPEVVQWDGMCTPGQVNEYELNIAEGTLTTSLRVDRDTTLSIYGPDGVILDRRTGSGIVQSQIHVARETVTIRVSDGIASQYTLTVSYPPR